MYRDLFFPLIILLVLTALIWFADLDLAIEGIFFSPQKGWFLLPVHYEKFFYHYGIIPGLVMAGSGLLIMAAGFFSKTLRPHRKIALFLILLMLLGPGLVVSGIKEQWERPRPREIQNFDGDQKFIPAWFRGVPGDYISFPSGHAAMGFYLFAPFFFLRKTSKKWAYAFLTIGIAYGALMGLLRMMAGAHFASDVIWSGGLVYLTGLILSYIFRFHQGLR